MNSKIFYLKDHINNYYREVEDSTWIDFIDSISQKYVFFDILEPHRHTAAFVKSGSDESDYNFNNLISRSKIGPQPVILLTGYIGTGKTTTLRFFMDYLNTSSPCPCDMNEECPFYRPFIIYYSFQREKLDDLCSSQEAKERFISSLNSFLSSALQNKSNYKDPQKFALIEIKDFIDFILQKSKNNLYDNPAFSWIISKLEGDSSNYDKRKSILADLKRLNNDLTLIYLLSFIGFIQRIVLEKHPECALVLLDDLDHSSIPHQEAIIEALSRFTYDQNYDPQLIIAIRPESGAGKNFGTIFYDKCPHKPPMPAKVLEKRVSHTLDNYDKLTSVFNSSTFNSNDSKIFYEYLNKLKGVLSENDFLKEFLKSISNGSARLAIYSGDGLIKISRSKMQKDINIFDLIRACITRGHPYYEPIKPHQHPVKNIYELKGYESTKPILLKLRILKILKKERKLSVIKTILNKFKYPIEMQISALNDLLENPWPLIYSTGADRYVDENHLNQCLLDNLSRTELGVGYGKSLWDRNYYCQEMMFSCWLFADNFKINITSDEKLNDNSLQDRLELYLGFLKSILDQEMEDINSFFLDGFGAMPEYKAYFGSTIYSLRLINEAMQIINNIIKNEQSQTSTRNTRWEKIKTDFENLQSLAIFNNSKIFGS